MENWRFLSDFLLASLIFFFVSVFVLPICHHTDLYIASWKKSLFVTAVPSPPAVLVLFHYHDDVTGVEIQVSVL